MDAAKRSTFQVPKTKYNSNEGLGLFPEAT